jgi:uncharacterized protein
MNFPMTMQTSSLIPGFLFALLLAVTPSLFSAEPAPAAPPAEAAPPKTFLIVLRLTPKFHDQKAWTDAENSVVNAHFKRLQEAAAAGDIVLVGRTEESFDRTQGLVVFTAADEAAARKFMNEDPCIVAGIMTGTLHPYRVFLSKKS